MIFIALDQFRLIHLPVLSSDWPLGSKRCPGVMVSPDGPVDPSGVLVESLVAVVGSIVVRVKLVFDMVHIFLRCICADYLLIYFQEAVIGS